MIARGTVCVTRGSAFATLAGLDTTVPTKHNAQTTVPNGAIAVMECATAILRLGAYLAMTLPFVQISATSVGFVCMTVVFASQDLEGQIAGKNYSDATAIVPTMVFADLANASASQVTPEKHAKHKSCAKTTAPITASASMGAVSALSDLVEKIAAMALPVQTVATTTESATKAVAFVTLDLRVWIVRSSSRAQRRARGMGFATEENASVILGILGLIVRRGWSVLGIAAVTACALWANAFAMRDIMVTAATNCTNAKITAIH